MSSSAIVGFRAPTQAATRPIAGTTLARCLLRQTQSRALLHPRSKSSVASRRCSVTVRANYGAQWSTPEDSYLTLGLAHCFEKNSDGKLSDCFVIEPISANALECMATGARTCFTHVFSLTLGEALARNKAALPAEFQDGIFCEEFATRCDSCARTWMRPHAMDNLLSIVPLGQLKAGFNYDITDKRVLNMENIVNDDDNIKQDISIDVYGRKEKEALQSDPVVDAAAAAAAEEEEDELDSLLAG